MKKIGLLCILSFLVILGQANFQTQPVNKAATFDSDKGVIVYLSRTNNTKAIAEIIHQEIGGDLVALELETPYPEDYKAIVQQVQRENETGFLPPLKTRIDLTKYDKIFLGFPTWGMRLPPPFKSFLTHHDLSGKTVIPFNTNAGYGVGSSFRTVKDLCPNSKILKGFSIQGGIERDGVYLAIKGSKKEEAKKEVKQWLSDIGILP
ncbi:MAG: flavodoxin [Bacteroidia bacterium]|nr:flavodoxin [Bacteroidia bacterium]